MAYGLVARVVVAAVLCVLVGGASIIKDDNLRLISFNETSSSWLTLAEIKTLQDQKINFMDITDHLFDASSDVQADPLPNQPIHKIYVQEVSKLLDAESLRAYITKLSSFPTRYYTTATGRDAAEWILNTFSSYAEAAGRKDITVQFFNHTWVQPSVIATIPGIGPHKDQVVVIGGHEDSTSRAGNAPGADDDATGTSTVIEVFRVLVAAGHYPDRTLKFMTYAAEEAGLLGSQAIAASYAAQKVNVYAVLQLDMTGYGGEGQDIGVVGDYVSAELSQFVKLLVDSYSVLTWTDTLCGYGCSDHASWNRNGYRASFPFETEFSRSNPYIHTQNDVISHLTLSRIYEFAKVGLGFVVELGGVAVEL